MTDYLQVNFIKIKDIEEFKSEVILNLSKVLIFYSRPQTFELLKPKIITDFALLMKKIESDVNYKNYFKNLMNFAYDEILIAAMKIIRELEEPELVFPAQFPTHYIKFFILEKLRDSDHSTQVFEQQSI